jgi:type IV secretion system protein TrbL
MSLPSLWKIATTGALLLGLLFFSVEAQAAIDNSDVLDNVLARYSAAASTWAATITARASWLFWTLALISMVWTFGMLALRKADIGEFYAEFARFTIFTGFFWWLLTNGPTFATDIMMDFGHGDPLLQDRSGYRRAAAHHGAVGRHRQVLRRPVLQQHERRYQPQGISVMLIVAVVLLALVNKVPALIGGLAMHGGTHALGGGFGTGAAMGAAAVAGAAVATGGAAIAAGAASAAGGAQALMAAYSKASAASSEGGGGGGMGDTMGGVAMAAAGPGGGSSGGGSVFAGMDTGSSSGSGSGGGSSGSSGSGGGFGGGASEGGSSGGKSSAPAGEGKDSGGGAAPGAEGKADAGGKAAGSDAKGGGQGTGLAPGEQRSTGSMLGRAAAIAAGTAGNLAQGSWDVAKAKAASMRESALDRISETTGGKIAAAIRAQDAAAPADLSTPAPAPSSAAQASTAATAFNDNELSAGKGQAETPVAPEVADFMNRNSKTS